jgi:hypothetical protein
VSYRLSEEINETLDALAAEGREWNASWVAQEICRRHEGGLSDNEGDAAFWLHTGYSDTRREVTRCINRRAGKEADRGNPAQIVLPGFTHLHHYYVVTRAGEDVGVPVFDMTDAELLAKRTEYEAMGAACFAHAREIERFRQEREAA